VESIESMSKLVKEKFENALRDVIRDIFKFKKELIEFTKFSFSRGEAPKEIDLNEMFDVINMLLIRHGTLVTINRGQDGGPEIVLLRNIGEEKLELSDKKH
jgi:hypothetical protein